MIALLLQGEQIPVALGPIPTIGAFIVIFVQAVINFLAWRRSTQAAHLKGTVEAVKGELEVYHKKTDRLEEEVKELHTENGACRKQLERVTKWYLEAKGEEEDEARRQR